MNIKYTLFFPFTRFFLEEVIRFSNLN